MAGLVPAIHVLRGSECRKNVDARHKAGHDGVFWVELIKLSTFGLTVRDERSRLSRFALGVA